MSELTKEEQEELAQEEGRDPKGLTDKVLSRVISRKLLVWLTATYALFSGVLESSDWVGVALAYISIQGLADIAATWKHGKEY